MAKWTIKKAEDNKISKLQQKYNYTENIAKKYFNKIQQSTFETVNRADVEQLASSLESLFNLHVEIMHTREVENNPNTKLDFIDNHKND